MKKTSVLRVVIGTYQCSSGWLAGIHCVAYTGLKYMTILLPRLSEITGVNRHTQGGIVCETQVVWIPILRGILGKHGVLLSAGQEQYPLHARLDPLLFKLQTV